MKHYEVFRKHAIKVCDNATEARPVLRGLFFAKDTGIYATDGHRIYAYSAQHGGDEKVIDPRTSKLLDHGIYPDVFRVMPSEDQCDKLFRVSIADLEPLLDIAHELKLRTITVKQGTGRWLIDGKDSAWGFRYESESPCASERFAIMFSAVYARDALKMFKQLGARFITFKFSETMRPFYMTGSVDLFEITKTAVFPTRPFYMTGNGIEAVKALILPVRHT